MASIAYRVTIAAALAGLTGASCFHQEANYCADLPNHNCLDVIDAGPPRCAGDPDCSAPTGVCDLAGTMMCVQCTTTDNPCGSATPVCVTNQCQKCTMHAQCAASDVCLPDGSCANADDVAYVQSGAMGAPPCTKAAPCGTLAEGVNANKPAVKLATGTVADTNTTTIDGKTVTILADPGAKLDRLGDGVILEVRGNGTDVSIYDLEITGATGLVTDAAISIPNGGAPKLTLTRVTVDHNQGVGISASGGTLSVTQSTISGSGGGGITATGGTLTVTASTLSGNTGGGISVSGADTNFDIENNIIDHNGTDQSSGQVGGVAIISNTNGSKFERNTVAFNRSNGNTFRGGASCNGPLASATGNLMFHNSESDGAGGIKTEMMTQFNGAGGCQYGNTLAVPTDAGNLGFKSPLVVPFDFHLTAASPGSVVDAAGSCTGTDVDGDTRPIGGACDFGADEYHP